MKNAALSLLRAYECKTLPIDPLGILKKLGYAVSGRANFKAGAWGEIHSSPLGVRIEYDANQSLEHQRLTLAHMLGHVVLGHAQNKGVHIECNDYLSLQNPCPKELQANQFGVELLIPEPMLRYLVRREGVRNVNLLMKIFQVPESWVNQALQQNQLLEAVL